MIIQHPMLAQIVEQITEKVPQGMEQAFDDAIMAGLQMMHHPETHQQMLDHLDAEGDVAENIGEGVAKLVAMIMMETKGKMPPEAVINAGVVLVMHGIEFAAQSEDVVINEKTIDTASDSYSAYLLQLLGWTPDKLNDALLAQQGEANDAFAAPGQEEPQGVISKTLKDEGVK